MFSDYHRHFIILRPRKLAIDPKGRGYAFVMDDPVDECIAVRTNQRLVSVEGDTAELVKNNGSKCPSPS